MADGAIPHLVVEFAGERFEVAGDKEFAIGRDGDLVIDENRYLHRRFLTLTAEAGMWWLNNVGTRIAATVTDGTGRVHARLAPGARLPVVFDRLHVLFGAGSTSYDLTLHTARRVRGRPRPASRRRPATRRSGECRSARRSVCSWWPSPRTCCVRWTPAAARFPASVDAAARLGWTLTAFTRKLDTVCGKLEREGVTGLRGGRGKLATNRRMRLVEHAVATRLVTREDLVLLEGPIDQLPAT